MAEQQALQENIWLKDFLLTWINRFSFFLAHHLTRPILPLYVASFDASSTVIGAVMAVFTITATLMRFPIGMFIDRLGRKPFLLAGIAFFIVGNFGYLWAPTILLLIPARIIHGIGWSACTTAVATLAADIAPQKRRGELIGYAAMASSLGGAVGPVLGFALLKQLAYPGVFLGTVALLLGSLLLAALIPEPKRAPAASVKKLRWIDLLVVPETLLPAVAVAFLSFGHGGILTFLPIHALKLGLENPGYWFGLYAFCLFIVRPVAGPLSDRISRRAVILPGLFLNFTSIVLLVLADSPAWLMAAAVVGGLGTGAAQPALMTVAVDQTSPQRRGQSMAQYQSFYDLGIGVGSLTLGAFLDLVDRSYSLMYVVAAVVALAGLWIYWRRSTPMPATPAIAAESEGRF
ncbi:MAG: MFS transporter [Deltaproteobacteria bacterium]|nr:MFS transporter [Deltaproteobacteria bacterium]